MVCRQGREDVHRVFELVMANQATFPVRTMCRTLGVSSSGYHDWCERAPSRRQLDDAVLTERIRSIHAESDATYGAPRIRAELVEQGTPIARKRVARLMRQARLQGVSRRRGFVVTTQRDARQRPAPDLVRREFKAEAPNKLWIADMTYVPTWAGFIYLAVVLDVWSRRVVGWAIGERMTADLVLAALNMALEQRKPQGGVIHHSDQGSQYTSIANGRALQEDGRAPFDGHGRRRLRQRHGRELLRQPGVRAHRSAQLQDQNRGTAGSLLMDRGLVQPAPAPQQPRPGLAS